MQVVDVQRLRKSLIFENLRPKESQPANTHLFFGVELKTRTEKPQDTENLKVPGLIYFQQKKTTPIRERSRRLFYHNRSPPDF